MAAWSAWTPLARSAPSPTPEPISGLSAQRAEAERGKIYWAGLAYSNWLDGLAEKSGSEFLQRPVFDRVTWMRLLACAASLALIAALTGWFLWFVRRRAGEIDSNQHQSWLALAAAAIRKPLALIVWVIGGFLASMPIVAGIASPTRRVELADGLTAILYAGRVIAILWLIFQTIRAIEKRMRHWAQQSGSVLNNVLVPVAGQTLRLAVPLLAVLLLLPLLTLTFVAVRTWDLRRLIVPITYFIEKPFQNWSRKSDQILGTVFLYLDYQVPLGELREEVKRLVDKNENWDRKVCGVQVTDTKPNTIEVRVLMSSLNAGKNFDLRCQVREGLIEFLRSQYPESLPRVRMEMGRLDESPALEARHASTLEGKEHERGPSAPGLKKSAS